MLRTGTARLEILVLIVALSCLAGLGTLALGQAKSQSQLQLCGQNLRNVARSLQNYHDLQNYLPAGARTRSEPPNYTTASFGQSWIASILPYTYPDCFAHDRAPSYRKCDQRPLWEKLYGTNFVAANDYNSAAILAVAHDQDPKYLLCPSSPLPKQQTVGKSRLIVPSYAGIMGALPAGEPDSKGSDQRFVVGPYGGFAAGNGLLPINDWIKYVDCRDGTANTILVGEVSTWYYDDAGNALNPALSMVDAGDGKRGPGGWQLGCSLDIKPLPPKAKPSGVSLPAYTVDKGQPAVPADRVCNIITIQHALQTNNKKGKSDADPNWGTAGVGRCGLNNPLLSAHAEGVNVAFLDSHVRTLSTKVDAQILRQLAIRDDRSGAVSVGEVVK